jgi:tetratricopeptide (TPR) repeat protein
MGMLLVTGLIFLTLIMGPLAFRSLSDENQNWFVRHFPFMAVWRPTVPAQEQVIPTIAVTGANALALLDTSVPTATWTPTVPPVPPTATLSATFTIPPTVTPLPIIVVSSATPSSTPTTAPPSTTPAVSPAILIISSPVLPSQTASSMPLVDGPNMKPSETAAPTLTETPTLAPPTATATILPTEKPTSAPTLAPTVPPTLAPSNTPAPIPVKFRLSGMTWEPQKWNNCGPANLVEAMRYYGWHDTQDQVASYLKPTQNDKNVSPWELVNYVNTKTDLRALSRVAGSLDLVKQLVARQFAVILETGFFDPDNPTEGWIGHYQAIVAYDDSQSRIYAMDTLKNERWEDYATTDDLWSDFNRVYVVVYRPEREAELAALIGPDMDTRYNAQHALEVARAAARQRPDSPFAWFDMGSSFVLLGQYPEAAAAYDQASSVGGGQLPYRMLWYQFGPYEAYYNAGRFDQALALIEFTIGKAKGNVEEMFYWRGMISATKGDTAAAIDDFNRALQFNMHFSPAQTALQQVQSGAFKGPIATPSG